MFEDTLLIVKADYIAKEKDILIKLLDNGFQIQARRKLRFSPELAAEFLSKQSDRKDFMLQVILLSKGPSDAIILTKKNALQDLVTAMICFFGSSDEMERYVYVSQVPEHVLHEITFIFPNYIKEPLKCFDRHRFHENTMIKPLVEELYELSREPTDGSNPSAWRIKLAQWFVLSNKALPRITNQGIINPTALKEEKGQQVKFPPLPCDHGKNDDIESMPSVDRSSLNQTSRGSSMIMSSSSCVSCSGFGDTELCIHQVKLPEANMETLNARIRELTVEPKKIETKESKEEHGEGLQWLETSEGSQCEEEELPIIHSTTA